MDRQVVEMLYAVQKDVSETKATVQYLKDNWERTDIPVRLDRLEMEARRQGEKCIEVQKKKQKPLIWLVTFVTAVLTSVITTLVNRSLN